MSNFEINAHSKHPRGLWFIGASTALYCFAFGSINSLLVLYAKKLGLDQKDVYALFAAYNSLLFTLPLLGGYLSGKFGYKNAYCVGLLFCLLGCLGLTIPDKTFLYVGLAAFAVGVGLAAPASYCLAGALYAKQDGRRESGYTLFYMIFNIGFALSAIIGGYASEKFGYASAFWIDAGAIVIGFLSLLSFTKHIQAYEGESMGMHVSMHLAKIIGVLVLFCLALTPLCMFLLSQPSVDNILLWVLVVGSSLAVIWLAFKQRGSIAKLKIIAFLILSAISIAFWALYMLEPSLVTVFIEKNVNRHGIPPSVFYSLNPIFIIVFGILFSWLWRHLNRKGKNLSLPSKFSASLFFIGAGFLILGVCAIGKTALISPWWIVFAYMFFTVGELMISPIGLSMVGRLAPEKKEGMLMGVWQLFTGFSAVVSGYIASATIPSIAQDEKIVVPLTTSNPIYEHSFFLIGGSTVAVGFLALLLVPTIKRLLSKPREAVRMSEL